MWLVLIFCGILFAGTVANRELDFPRFNKEIVVAFSKRPPFVFQNENGTMNGLDILIIENFAKKFNLQIKYNELCGSLNEIFNEEETIDKYLKSVNMGNVDIFIGALEENLITNKHFTASRAYYHDYLTWCVQAKQPIPTWKNIFFACEDPVVLVTYTVMCFVVVFTGYFMQRFEDLQPKWDWFRITLAGFAPNVGFVSPYDPKILPHRMAYIACVFGAMITNILFNSIMILLMSTKIYENQIGSIHEIINGNFELAGDGFALQHLKKQNQTYPIKILDKFTVCDDLNLCLSQLNHNPKLAVAISREQVRNSRIIPISKIYCFENFDTIHEYALKFLIQKDFPYESELNRFIQMASAGGLIEKWRSISKIQSKFQNEGESYEILTLESLYGIFMILIPSYAFLITMFVFEKIVYKKAQKPNPFCFWLFIEMVIDPYRHFWNENVCF